VSAADPTEAILKAIRAEKARQAQEGLRVKQDRSIEAVKARCAESLAAFVVEAWPIVEPIKEYVHGFHIDAICEHLEAITDGDITRLLINVPPGFSKSLLVSVFWPCWEWGPRGLTSMRYIATSFKEAAVNRDNRRMRDIVTSEWFQRHWPMGFKRLGELSFENEFTGWREGAAFGSLTSKRADRLIIDDPHSVDKAESQIDRENTVRKFREGAFNRLNDQGKSAIVVVMQRLHEGDISGVILDNDMGYVPLILPMEYESSRHCETSIGFSDPRRVEGELLDPQRFPPNVISAMKSDSNVYVWAGQYQQRPGPRGGGIIPYNSWEFWDRDLALKYGRSEKQFPDFDLIIGSVDSAFTEKQENDMSAMVVLGIWADLYAQPRVMVMFFWKERLKFNDLCMKIIATGRKLKIDKLLIENKASGISVGQEIIRETREETFAVQLINPGNQDKQARAHSVSSLFREEKEDGTAREGLIYVPVETQGGGAQWPRHWADSLMVECAAFPKGRHDDGVDSLVQGLRWLRDRGLIKKTAEIQAEEYRELTAPYRAPRPLYPGVG
jgi:predicted phage terminase large subunit-like protein